jgi:membrane-associated phospholipid phosphatase
MDDPLQPAGSSAADTPGPGSSTERAGLSGRRWSRSPSAAWRFTMAALVAGLLLWLDYAAFVLTEAGQRLENLGLAGSALRDQVDREGSLLSLSQISMASFGIAILVVFGTALIRRRPGLGILAAVVMIVSVALAEIMKELVARPELVSGPAWLLRNSFPSGHATVAASIAVGALLVAPGRLRWLVVPAGAIYVAVIGQATQIAGWHRLSGALGGVLIVFIVASIALVVLALAGQVAASEDGRVHRRIRLGLLVAGGVVLALGALILALPVLFPLLVAPTGATSAFVHTSLDLVGVGLTIIAFVAFAFVLEPFSLGRPAGASQDVVLTAGEP